MSEDPLPADQLITERKRRFEPQVEHRSGQTLRELRGDAVSRF